MFTKWTCGFYKKHVFTSTLDALLLGKRLRKKEMYPCKSNKGSSICGRNKGEKQELIQSEFFHFSVIQPHKYQALCCQEHGSEQGTKPQCKSLSQVLPHLGAATPRKDGAEKAEPIQVCLLLFWTPLTVTPLALASLILCVSTPCLLPPGIGCSHPSITFPSPTTRIILKP